MATLPDGAKYAKIMEDEDKLLEFERQLIVNGVIIFFLIYLFLADK